MPGTIDQIMECASDALRRMNYLECESLCLQALAEVRSQSNWVYYSRVLLPLQEARRQRRMIAAGGVVRLGSTDLPAAMSKWPDNKPDGCIVLTDPHKAQTAQQLEADARQQRRHIEVLFADCQSFEETWTLRSYQGPEVSCDVAAPPVDWLDCWLAPTPPPSEQSVKNAFRAADWFLNSAEALGDAAMAQIDASANAQVRVEALEQCLHVVSDHEILHQKLGEAVRELVG